MTTHQDSAIPALPEPELPPLPATQLRFQVELTPTGERLDYTARDMNARYVEGYEAGRTAGRASAEPDGVREALRNLLAMLPSDHEDRPSTERIPASYCYVRWIDIREARAALAATPTPTASIAPKAEGEAEKWIEWNGGEMPVADWKIVEYRFRQGGLSFFNSAGGLFWHHDGKGDDIVAYRLPPQGITKCAAPVAQAAAGARQLLSEYEDAAMACTRTGLAGDAPANAIRAEGLRRLKVLEALRERVFAALSSRPSADADRASGGGV